ncbi:MAG: GNAT family N-acetyltransferase [Pseudomonadota bacterium]
MTALDMLEPKILVGSTTVTVPRLVAGDLVLRAPTSADFEPYAEILASSRSQFLNGPYNRADAWKDFSLSVAEWVLFGLGPLAIETRGTFAGLVSISTHPDFPEPEMGWVLTSDAEGKGIACRASRILMSWAAQSRTLPSLVSYMWPGNDRAAHLATRLGGQLDRAAPKPWPGAMVYRYPIAGDAILPTDINRTAQ